MSKLVATVRISLAMLFCSQITFCMDQQQIEILSKGKELSSSYINDMDLNKVNDVTGKIVLHKNLVSAINENKTDQVRKLLTNKKTDVNAIHESGKVVLEQLLELAFEHHKRSDWDGLSSRIEQIELLIAHKDINVDFAVKYHPFHKKHELEKIGDTCFDQLYQSFKDDGEIIATDCRYIQNIQCLLCIKDIDDCSYAENFRTKMLMWSAKYGYAGAVKFILSTSEIDVNMVDKDNGETALTIASNNNETKIVDILRFAGATYWYESKKIIGGTAFLALISALGIYSFFNVNK